MSIPAGAPVKAAWVPADVSDRHTFIPGGIALTIGELPTLVLAYEVAENIALALADAHPDELVMKLEQSLRLAVEGKTSPTTVRAIADVEAEGRRRQLALITRDERADLGLLPEPPSAEVPNA